MSLFSISFSCGCNSENKLNLRFVIGVYPPLKTFTVLDVSKLLYNYFSQSVVDTTDAEKAA